MRIQLSSIAIAVLLAGSINVHAQEKVAIAEVKPASGSQVSGTVTFTQKGDKVMVNVKMAGLSALHGFHIHEKGDCSAADAASAGAHFNPAKSPHGDRHAKNRHAGDMGNLARIQPDNPIVEDSFEMDGISVGSAADNDIVNRAVIVHADPDDLRSQPAGNAGKRIGCGVISIKQ